MGLELRLQCLARMLSELCLELGRMPGLGLRLDCCGLGEWMRMAGLGWMNMQNG